MEYVRHIIIPIKVVTAGQVIIINKQIPSYLKKCVGVSVSVVGYVATNLPKINMMGMITLKLNNERTVALQSTVGYNKDLGKQQRQGLLLNIPLWAGNIMTANYTDNNTSIGAGNEFLPYTINIMLQTTYERAEK